MIFAYFLRGLLITKRNCKFSVYLKSVTFLSNAKVFCLRKSVVVVVVVCWKTQCPSSLLCFLFFFSGPSHIYGPRTLLSFLLKCNHPYILFGEYTLSLLDIALDLLSFFLFFFFAKSLTHREPT